MSSFICEHCDELIVDTRLGYKTGCAHYSPDLAYDAKHDAWYRIKGGVWLDGKCADPDCEFCRDRPDRRNPA